MTVTQSAQALERFDLFIAGEPAPPGRGDYFESVDPAAGRPWALAAEADADDVDRAVSAARDAFRGEAWRTTPASERGLLLFRLADALADEAERIARIESRDNGKLLREMLAQNRLVPKWVRYFGGLADKVEGATIPLDRLSVLNYTTREALGVVGVIMPWNSPVFLAMMAVAPALAAGNTVVVKPSEVTPGSMVEVARLAHEVGFPPGVLNVVTGGGEAGRALVEHPEVAKVSLTGGIETGRRIAATVGERLGHVTLELGGKSANVVFADADLDAAVPGLLAGIFAAAGQTCVAGSRALVHEDVLDEVLERVHERAARIRLGDPSELETEVGPIATAAQLERVEGFVERARAAGAEVVLGGRRAHVEALPDGYFYEPTIVRGVDPDGELAQGEVFGPVLAVLGFREEEEAVRIANGTRYGLAAGVWTRDLQRAHRVAGALEAGTVWVNMYRAMAPQSPFGGFKESGIGRQNGIEAIDEYLQTKSVWVELSSEAQDPFILKT